MNEKLKCYEQAQKIKAHYTSLGRKLPNRVKNFVAKAESAQRTYSYFSSKIVKTGVRDLFKTSN